MTKIQFSLCVSPIILGVQCSSVKKDSEKMADISQEFYWNLTQKEVRELEKNCECDGDSSLRLFNYYGYSKKDYERQNRVYLVAKENSHKWTEGYTHGYTD